jgi:Trypsin-like peptidase domain
MGTLSTDHTYWVKLFQEDVFLGAGFLLTPCYAVTAYHCISGIAAGNEALDVSFADGDKVPARIHRRDPDADLALIDIPESGISSAAVPTADLPEVNESWHGPYRPDRRSAYLSGEVTAIAADYECDNGGLIEVMQLRCRQSVGGYAGYSGSPVERRSSDDSHTVLGILLEEYPDRAQGNQGHSRASNVLFAPTVAEIFRRFDCFHVSHLLNLLYPQRTETSSGAPTGRPVRDRPLMLPEPSDRQVRPEDGTLESRIHAARYDLAEIREWVLGGLVDEQEARQVRRHILRERELADGGISGDT